VQNRPEVRKKTKETTSRPEYKAKLSKAIRLALNDPVLKERFRELRANQIFPMVNTSIEKAVARWLTACGIVYKQQARIRVVHKYHQFDFALPERQLLIEVQGCYWHCCKQCGHADKRRKSDFDLALPELKKHAATLGWQILELWEHAILDKSAFQTLIATIEARPHA